MNNGTNEIKTIFHGQWSRSDVTKGYDRGVVQMGVKGEGEGGGERARERKWGRKTGRPRDRQSYEPLPKLGVDAASRTIS